MSTKKLPQEVFETYLDKKLSSDEEYSLFTLASPEQLKEFFRHQRLSPVFEEQLPQLLDESAAGLEAIYEYFDCYELENKTLMKLMYSHNVPIISYYIVRHPLTKEALAYLESGVIPDYLKLLAAYRDSQKESVAYLSYDDFAKFVSQNKLSSLQIKMLIDENKLPLWRCFLKSLYKDEKTSDPLLSEKLQMYLLENGSDNAIGIYFQFGYLGKQAEKKLVDSRKKFLILLYIMKYPLNANNENALLHINDFSLISIYNNLYGWNSTQALEKINDLAGWSIL